MDTTMPVLKSVAPMSVDTVNANAANAANAVDAMEAMGKYDAQIDTKKRLMLRGISYDRYHVGEFANGIVGLKPQVPGKTFDISEDTLRMIKASAENFKKGIVSEPVDLSEFDED